VKAVGAAGPAAIALGLARLAHPFPSLLNGVAAGAVAVVAGADVAAAGRLGLGMTLLHVSIGALNDVLDAAADAAAGRTAKPIASGLLSPRLGLAVAFGSAILGLGLAATFGLAVLAVAALGLAIGYAYDLVAKGTAWSWLPFALGIPLVPVYGWLAGAGELPPLTGLLAAAAILAGAALAIANAAVDVERDRASASTSIAMRLGPRHAWRAVVVLWSAVAVLALGGLLLGVPSGPDPMAVAVVVAGMAVIAVGVVVGRSPRSERRERGWEAQAVGLAVLAAGWLWAVAI
jgi:4-hydroxybenzoate polyprenyltransferase